MDVMGLAETFLQREEEIEVGGYTWHGQNRQNCNRASGGVGLLVNESIATKVSDRDWYGLKS